MSLRQVQKNCTPRLGCLHRVDYELALNLVSYATPQSLNDHIAIASFIHGVIPECEQ